MIIEEKDMIPVSHVTGSEQERKEGEYFHNVKKLVVGTGRKFVVENGRMTISDGTHDRVLVGFLEGFF